MPTSDTLRTAIETILPQLPGEIGDSRLVPAYVSPCQAHRYGYQKDEFHRESNPRRSDFLRHLIASANEPLDGGGTDLDRQWTAGYHFNNALLRVAFLGEVGLNCLSRKMVGRSGANYDGLIKWYDTTFPAERLVFLNRVREDTNYFKHRSSVRERRLERIDELEGAFEELVVVLKKLIDGVGP